MKFVVGETKAHATYWGSRAAMVWALRIWSTVRYSTKCLSSTLWSVRMSSGLCSYLAIWKLRRVDRVSKC
jgi:hypothetical protein